MSEHLPNHDQDDPTSNLTEQPEIKKPDRIISTSHITNPLVHFTTDNEIIYPTIEDIQKDPGYKH